MCKLGPGLDIKCRPQPLPTLFSETESLKNLNAGLAGLAVREFQRSSCLDFPLLGSQACSARPSFFSVDAGDRNSGPHARIANTSPIELSVSLAHCLEILDVGIPDITLSAVQMGTELLIPVQEAFLLPWHDLYSC